MLRIAARRLALAPLTLLLVSFTTFVLLRVTGDPIDIFLDINRTPEQVEALRQRLHLDQPLVIQYLLYVKDLLTGDFGQSLQYGGPAINAVLPTIMPTLQLVGLALFLAVALGVAAGFVAAIYKDKVPDVVLSTLAVIGQSMPSFWLGILLIQFFSLRLQWLPTSGRGGWENLVLPSLTLAAFLLPNFMLVTRTAILDLMSEQFVQTARAKGLSFTRILLTHVFPNMVNPLLSFLGIQIGTLVGGSIITESIFGWPGIGRLMIGAVANRDVPVVLVTVFIVSVTIIIANLIVDVLQSIVDPRVRQ